MAKMAFPIADLKKLGARMLYEAGADGAPWLFTALGSFAKDSPVGDFSRMLEWDLREIRRCNERGIDSSLRQWIISYETRIPPEAGMKTDIGEVKEFLGPVLDRFAALTFGQLTPYFELPWDGDWRHAIPVFADALASWVEESSGAVAPGIKIRTGGTFVPASEQLALVVETCVSRGLRFKATQGLHHALTHRDDKGRVSHGFVNLFTALALAQGLGTDRFGTKEIARLLDEENRVAFSFSAEALRWSGHEIDCEAIEAGRRRHAATFGSCSLDEPDEFLTELEKEVSK
jgi:hypothetical protein